MRVLVILTYNTLVHVCSFYIERTSLRDLSILRNSFIVLWSVCSHISQLNFNVTSLTHDVLDVFQLSFHVTLSA